MITLSTTACILCALFFLIRLTIIDLKTRLLPNIDVAAFLLCGALFHLSTNFAFDTIYALILGLLCGGGLLLCVRLLANTFYGFDTLGLGDVKLMGAAGFWLGFDHIFLAISIGALAGLFHGLIYGMILQKKTGEKINLSKLSIPAGPGFIIGIILVGILKFYTLPALLF